MERRTFLMGAGMAFAARGANDKVSIGVIGIGGRGRGHVQYYGKLPDAQVVALCDVNTAQTLSKRRRAPSQSSIRTSGACWKTRASMPSRSPLLTTGTPWPPSGPAR